MYQHLGLLHNVMHTVAEKNPVTAILKIDVSQRHRPTDI